MRKLIVLTAMLLLTVGIASATAAPISDVVSVDSTSCGSSAGTVTTTLVEGSETGGPIQVGSPCFNYFRDWDIYLTDPGTGLVSDHIFSNESLGSHDAIYFASDGMTDPSLGLPCPTNGLCIPETGLPQDLTAYVTGPNSSVSLNNLTVQSSVPEPTSMLLLGTGLVGFAGRIRRKLTR